MALLAMVFPIPPGKTDQWRRFMAELNGPRRADYEAWSQRLGGRGRVFLQQTPQGDLVLLTMEGDDPAQTFRAMGTRSDPFSQWFGQQVQDIHGVDLRQPPPGPLPELVLDSQPR